jgi:3-polyprenyl-4-hydroxybenzoate decarboxylase
MLCGKIVYIVVTGATRAKNIEVLLRNLKSEGAECVLMPTSEGYSMLNLSSIKNEWMKYDGRVYNPRAEEIPEEDLVVVAPCTFNTLSKIAYGIADNYPTSIIHAAIGKRKPVVIALAMNYWYLDHPLTLKHISKVSSFQNVSVVWPESVYSNDCKLEKVTMAPWEKICDTIHHKYRKAFYQERKMDGDISTIVEMYFPEFSKIGMELQENHYLNGSAGFLARRIPEGILVTTTGSLVGSLSRSNLSLIKNWDNCVVSWSGNSHPSSETPLIMEIFNSFPEIDTIIHGHCRSITYSPKSVRYNSSEYLKYGEWGELFKILPVLKEYQVGIMKLHGEIVLAPNFEEGMRRYLHLYNETF